MTDEEFLQNHEKIAKDLAESELLTFKIHPIHAYTAVSIIQLAWRHPELTQAQKAIVETLGRNLQALIGTASALAERSLEPGWDTSRDVMKGQA